MTVTQAEVEGGITYTVPAFPLGFAVKLDAYLGVLQADSASPFARAARVESMRLLCDPSDDNTGERVVSWPKGWEYQIVCPSRGSVWGWVSEDCLREHGYTPPGEA